MPVLAHWHDWCQTTAGWRCQSGVCTALFAPQAVGTNNNATGANNNGVDINTILNHAWKKSGGG